MTFKKFADYIRFKTKTTPTTFTDTQILLLANIFKDEIAKDILTANEDYLGVPETIDLVLGQREYPLPNDMLNQIKYVEAKLDGVNWIPLKEIDLVNYTRTTDESMIVTQFANSAGKAFFDIFRNSLWIYSGTIVTVLGGLKLWSFQWPADFADLSSEKDMSVDPSNIASGFPRPFHELLARRVIIEYKTSADKPLQLNQFEQKYDADLQKALNSISEMNLGRSTTAMYPSGSTIGNNGFDY